MSLKERVYSVLVVSAAEAFNATLLSLLPDSAYSPCRVTGDVSSAKRALAERNYDFVIINAPLPDDAGLRLAVDTAGLQTTVVLLLIRSEYHDEMHYKVAEHGVFTLPKPFSRQTMQTALSWMSSARERLRKNEKKALSMQDKMEEIRIVNRAKWLLITERKMEEAEAHRFIEKQAMDRCVSKRVIAEELLNHFHS